jgi:fatty acid desaturase
MAGFLHLINGPISITLISRSYVPERLAKRSVFAEIRHASPHVYALTMALLTLTWLLPLLVLGACLLLVLSH